jgi:hypothetical protein
VKRLAAESRRLVAAAALVAEGLLATLGLRLRIDTPLLVVFVGA